MKLKQIILFLMFSSALVISSCNLDSELELQIDTSVDFDNTGDIPSSTQNPESPESPEDVVTPSTVVDWTNISWIASGAGNDYSNKYKFSKVDSDASGNLVNIQTGIAAVPGIYLNGFDSVVTDCSLSKVKKEGASINIDVTNFTEGENLFTITTVNGGTKQYAVFYSKNGGTSVPESGTPSGNGGNSQTQPQKPETPPVVEGAVITDFIITGPASVNETNQISLKAAFKYSDNSTVEVESTSVTWTSSNKNVAHVSDRGTVTGISQGTAVITAKYGNDYSKTITVTVVADIDPETAVTSYTQITTSNKVNKPFGQIFNDLRRDSKFSVTFGAPSDKPDYWDLFVISSSGQEKKIVLTGPGATEVKVAYGAGKYNLRLYAVKKIDGVLCYSEPVLGEVTVTTNIVSKDLPTDADKKLANRTLVQKKDNTYLTLQFENNTGKYSDDQIWVTGFGKNEKGEWCYLSSTGTAIPIEAGSNSNSWSFKFSEVSAQWGLQVKMFESGRIYFTVGNEPVYMEAVGYGNNLGVAQPNLHAIDIDTRNKDKLFDWVEFTSGKNGLFINTTQVDAFTFPIVCADYSEDGLGGYEWRKSVGITNTRKEVFQKWEQWCNKYPEFRCLNRDGKRILAPCKVEEFNKDYMKDYITDVWNYYKTHDLEYGEREHGHYKGRVKDVVGKDGKTYGVLIMTRQSDGQKFFVYRQPNIVEAFEGSGVLAMDCSPAESLEWFGTTEYGNTEISKHVQNRICSAFTRHCFVKQGNDYINYMGVEDTPLSEIVSHYYQYAPANMYSGFFHKAVDSIDGFSYGFCYDDNHDQSTTTQDSNVYGCVISIGKWE